MARRANTVTTKSVSVEISFHGAGTIVEERPNVFSGGVVAPQFAGNLHFNVRRETPDEEGVLSPVPEEDTVKDAFKRKDDLVFLDFAIDPTENVYPMVQGGKGLTEMILSEEL